MALVVGWVGYFVGYSSDLKYGMGKLFAQAFIIGVSVLAKSHC